MTEFRDIQKQEQRAQAASLMLPWKQLAQVFADHARVSFDEIEDASDELIIRIMDEKGFSRRDLVADIPALQSLTAEDQEAVFDAIGMEHWTAENIRRGAREEAPLPFGLMVGGVFVDTSNGADCSIVWAAATLASDPDAVARTFTRQCRHTFGQQAFKDVSQRTSSGRTHEFTPEEMFAMHERGMSYKEIAIQTLRAGHPDIIESPGSFKSEIKKERERIIWVIRAAQKLWSARMPENSIG